MSLKSIQKIVPLASILIFLLCFAAALILIWFSLSKNDFRNNYVWFALGLYFFAKGIFCSLALHIISENSRLTLKSSK